MRHTRANINDPRFPFYYGADKYQGVIFDTDGEAYNSSNCNLEKIGISQDELVRDIQRSQALYKKVQSHLYKETPIGRFAAELSGELSRRLELDSVPCYFTLAGGSIASIYRNLKVNDYDFYFSHEISPEEMGHREFVNSFNMALYIFSEELRKQGKKLINVTFTSKGKKRDRKKTFTLSEMEHSSFNIPHYITDLIISMHINFIEESKIFDSSEIIWSTAKSENDTTAFDCNKEDVESYAIQLMFIPPGKITKYGELTPRDVISDFDFTIVQAAFAVDAYSSENGSLYTGINFFKHHDQKLIESTPLCSNFTNFENRFTKYTSGNYTDYCMEPNEMACCYVIYSMMIQERYNPDYVGFMSRLVRATDYLAAIVDVVDSEDKETVSKTSYHTANKHQTAPEIVFYRNLFKDLVASGCIFSDMFDTTKFNDSNSVTFTANTVHDADMVDSGQQPFEYLINELKKTDITFSPIFHDNLFKYLTQNEVE
jgi:hypothetical protein